MGHTHTNQKLPPFDELVQLAKSDPEAFNQFKQQMCEQMIGSASEVMQDRLRAQQSHIDLVVDRCKNPHHANVVLMQELRSQVGKFQDALKGRTGFEDPQPDNVVAFRSTNTEPKMY
ncbi:DUF3135 domain-containing protein [uncultured Vibrio sp.]|uniref:DUF3135 domain-containing protein n=1 Tax=uncultured Vibrio sp. TaxID=114054 RepID=UPI0026051760|nr:DUF3135 domain-containing protein [uncultured Vibrio sp.]